MSIKTQDIIYGQWLDTIYCVNFTHGIKAFFNSSLNKQDRERGGKKCVFYMACMQSRNQRHDEININIAKNEIKAR